MNDLKNSERKTLTAAEISAAIEDLKAQIRGHGQAAVRGGTLSARKHLREA